MIQAKHITSRAEAAIQLGVLIVVLFWTVAQEKFYETKKRLLELSRLLIKVTPDAKNSDTWKWTFAELRTEYMKRVEADYQSGKKSKTFRTDKERHSRCF